MNRHIVSGRALALVLLALLITGTSVGVAHGAPTAVLLADVEGIVFRNPGQNGGRDINTQGNTGGVRIFANDTLTNPPNTAAIQFFGNGHTGFPGQVYIDSGAHNDAAIILRTAQTGGGIAERMRITADGRVGIGTAFPLAKLGVNGDMRVSGATVLEDNLSVFSNINVPFGKVGIATVLPRAALDLIGDIFVGLAFGAEPDFAVGSNSVFVANDGGDPKNSLRIDGASDNLYLVARSGADSTSGAGIVFRTATAGAGEMDRFFIGPSGNVTIGGTPVGPHGHLLDVAGPVHATSFPTSSDARFKAQVMPLSDVLGKLEQVRGISFEWNDLFASLERASGHREIGIIAQELEAVFPELVSTWGEENYRAVEYGRLTAVLLEAIKELRAEKDAQLAGQQERIKTLEQDLAIYQQQNAALEARLAALERLVRTGTGQ
ncbi:MAG TPA: tail fiber domain-containing protein [Chthonomonadales bacterium]|nr:tail fiber domain-containing protein [Chthonomonadales bacterium]